MRIVADTNVVVSAFLWGGPPREVLVAARDQRVALFTSAPLIAELEDVLGRAKFAPRFQAIGARPDELLTRYLALVHFVTPAPMDVAVSRDPDDDRVLAAAIAAKADLVVSGDRDLLDLGQFLAMQIVAADVAVRRIGKLGS